jgi:hypothetical protein
VDIPRSCSPSQVHLTSSKCFGTGSGFNRSTLPIICDISVLFHTLTSACILKIKQGLKLWLLCVPQIKDWIRITTLPETPVLKPNKIVIVEIKNLRLPSVGFLATIVGPVSVSFNSLHLTLGITKKKLFKVRYRTVGTVPGYKAIDSWSRSD